MKTKVRYIFLVISLVLIQSIDVYSPVLQEIKLSKLEIVKRNGVLKVVTDYNSTSYFIYKGQPMGYQFELLQELAKHLDVDLEVIANNNLDEKFEMLKTGEVDLIAVNLTVTKKRKQFLSFTEPHTQTRQVLVQRRPDNWRGLSRDAISDYLINNQLDLVGKKIYVQKNSTYANRLRNLSDEIGDSISIVETDYGVETLIEMVSKGEIDYTVSDENVALVNQVNLENIDISLPVSFPQNLAWALSKQDEILKEEIDTWMREFKKSYKYSRLYRKYYQSKRTSQIVDSEYFAITSGTISPYDVYIKKYSSEIDWDWRMVASMIYQESRFNPEAKSWAGAFGLMQFMPNTASRFGINQNSTPERQIQAGVSFIKWLDKVFEDVGNLDERQKFILASYNVGPGHVIDARKLAQKFGKNPNVWYDNVEVYLLKKSQPEFYNDPVVKYGYCRGIETYKYVSEVCKRTEHYRNLVE